MTSSEASISYSASVSDTIESSWLDPALRARDDSQTTEFSLSELKHDTHHKQLILWPLASDGCSNETLAKNQEIFLQWWSKTITAQQMRSKDNGYLYQMRWDSKHFQSGVWVRFRASAQETNGSVFVVCNRCKTKMAHPSPRNQGSGVLIRHLETGQCKKSINHNSEDGQSQQSLVKGFKNQV